ncbi:hypothetical protein LINGRAPRIM_LOCUS3385 [Linum grandiflorum]
MPGEQGWKLGMYLMFTCLELCSEACKEVLKALLPAKDQEQHLKPLKGDEIERVIEAICDLSDLEEEEIKESNWCVKCFSLNLSNFSLVSVGLLISRLSFQCMVACNKKIMNFLLRNLIQPIKETIPVLTYPTHKRNYSSTFCPYLTMHLPKPLLCRCR